MKETEIQIVIENLSRLIYSTMKALASEQKYPGIDANQMNDNLKTLEERYKKLKNIRDDFEKTCADVIIKED